MANKKNALIIGIIIVIAFIVLPTGTPEDLITTIPLIALFGLKTFLILALLLILVLEMIGISIINIIIKGFMRIIR